VKKYFFTGLVILLPVAVTIWLVRFFLNLLTAPFMGLISIWTDRLPFSSPQLIGAISQILIILALVLIMWITGFVAKKFFFHQLIRFGDNLLIKIPLVRKVYKTSKEIVNSLFGSKENSFQQVVLLPFPYHGSYCIGLISSTSPKTCSNASDSELLSIFIPTTPNPATGFLVMCNKKDLIYLNMKTEEAIKYVVSCAVIQPEEKTL
jgi:uncharacterized membrane protein